MHIRELKSKFAAKWLLHARETLFSHFTHSGYWEWKSTGKPARRIAKHFGIHFRIQRQKLRSTSADLRFTSTRMGAKHSPLAKCGPETEYSPAHMQKSLCSKFAFEVTNLHYFCRWIRKYIPKCSANWLLLRSSRLFTPTCHCVKNKIFRKHFSNAFP